MDGVDRATAPLSRAPAVDPTCASDRYDRRIDIAALFKSLKAVQIVAAASIPVLTASAAGGSRARTVRDVILEGIGDESDHAGSSSGDSGPSEHRRLAPGSDGPSPDRRDGCARIEHRSGRSPQHTIPAIAASPVLAERRAHDDTPTPRAEQREEEQRTWGSGSHDPSILSELPASTGDRPAVHDPGERPPRRSRRRTRSVGRMPIRARPPATRCGRDGSTRRSSRHPSSRGARGGARTRLRSRSPDAGTPCRSSTRWRYLRRPRSPGARRSHGRPHGAARPSSARAPCRRESDAAPIARTSRGASRRRPEGAYP